MLNILEHFDLKGAGFQSPLSIHLQTEAKRLAYEDRARYYADPDVVDVPADWLVSKAYAAERTKLIRPDRINDKVKPGEAPSRGDTPQDQQTLVLGKRVHVRGYLGCLRVSQKKNS